VQGNHAAEKIEKARQAGEFRSLVDFSRRTKLPRKITEKLILVGAF
jgi:DNA polymerase III alpha subunit (gram-positive type)